MSFQHIVCVFSRALARLVNNDGTALFLLEVLISVFNRSRILLTQHVQTRILARKTHLDCQYSADGTIVLLSLFSTHVA